jgi:hypothetical protein
MNTLAEVHMLKSEYVEARNIHIHIMQFTSPDKDPYNYTGALMNIAELDVSMGAPKDDVQVNIETTRKIFGTMGFVLGEQFCEAILADLYLREGNTLAAKPLFKKCINLSIGHSTQTISYCLERLGNIRRWNRSQTPSTATVLFLVHSLKFKEKLGLLKALQFLGDVFLGQDDEDTATSLYTVALNGFTQMDVHRSRAECMLCLGDISMEHGDLFKAVKLWATARPLFKRSSQVKQVECIDERLSRISTDVMKQYNINSASLTELKSGTAEVEGDLSGVEDL